MGSGLLRSGVTARGRRYAIEARPKSMKWPSRHHVQWALLCAGASKDHAEKTETGQLGIVQARRVAGAAKHLARGQVPLASGAAKDQAERAEDGLRQWQC